MKRMLAAQHGFEAEPVGRLQDLHGLLVMMAAHANQRMIEDHKPGHNAGIPDKAGTMDHRK